MFESSHPDKKPPHIAVVFLVLCPGQSGWFLSLPKDRPGISSPLPFPPEAGRKLAPEELRSGRPRRPPLRPLPSSPASFSQSEACKRACVFLLRKELVSDGSLPLPESGGGHVLRSQSLPALPGGVPSQFCPTCHPERSEGSRHARHPSVMPDLIGHLRLQPTKSDSVTEKALKQLQNRKIAIL